jgi:isoleucyl-tRNA synthetase
MQQLNKLTAEVIEAYESFAYHRVYGLIYNFCSVEMSSIYMDVLKDRMYCDAAKSLSRRSGQTAMYRILDALVRMLAPILVHTSEEAWAAIKAKSENVESVHLAAIPAVDAQIDHKADEAKWQRLMSVRDEVLRSLEGLRQNETIASNQEATITIATNDAALIQILNEFGLKEFASLCIVSEVKLSSSAQALTIEALKSPHAKCQRCWNYWPSVGTIATQPDICERCAAVVA